MTNDLPTEILEQRAAEQRRRLHNTVAEMRANLHEKMNVRRHVDHYSRQHFYRVAAAAGAAGLAAGWAFGGLFDRSR